MVTSIRSLLAVKDFHLRLLVSPSDQAVLDEPLTWVHSSDLPDPTPWLQPHQLLLTDGDFFRRKRTDQQAADEYIARLRAASVAGLGFATEIIHTEVPATLVVAAQNADYPLIEVADRTPFMSIIRHVADDIAAADRERLDWLNASQRAIARAALRVDGLSAILGELEERLDCWVALFDASGKRVSITARRPIPDALLAPVSEAVQRGLRGRVRSAGRIEVRGGEATVQTLGQRDRLRGVLAIGNPAPLDRAGSDLVASVIAIASIALEQTAALEESRRSLHSGLLQLLLAGNVTVAARSLERLGSTLPQEPVRVLVTSFDGDRALLEGLELGAQAAGGVFFAVDEDRLIIIASDLALADVEILLHRHGVTAGASAPSLLAELRHALAEAEWAFSAGSRGDNRVLLFDQLSGDGILGLLRETGGREAARRILEPVRLRHEEGDELLFAASVWLGHNGAWDPAAKELGLHRHTLKARMALLAQLLDLDLDRFGGRSELWAALQLDASPPRIR